MRSGIICQMCGCKRVYFWLCLCGSNCVVWGTDVCVNHAGVSCVVVNVNACVHVCARDWKLTVCAGSSLTVNMPASAGECV